MRRIVTCWDLIGEELCKEGLGQPGQSGDLLLQHLLVNLQLLDLCLIILPEFFNLLLREHLPEFPKVPWHYKIIYSAPESHSSENTLKPLIYT